MTEDEAKGKSCCGPLMIAATLAVAEIARLNGKGAEQFSGLCIGSACMAWRALSDVSGEILERRDMGVEPPPEGWHRSSLDHPNTLNKSFGDWIRIGPSKPAGYCGLAGSPQ